MNNISENIDKYLDPAKSFMGKYATYIYMIIMALIIGFLMLRIASLINAEPDTSNITTVKTISIDSEQANKIRSLKDQNIQIDPSINNTRNNPFQ